MKLKNKVYDFLKYFTSIFLPAVGALYYGLTEVWNIHSTLPVNATINTIIAFLGITLGLSSRQYNKNQQNDGDLVVAQVDGEKYLGLAVNKSIESMQAKDIVRLKVIDKSSDSEA